jgi:hypothetical protein
MQVAPSFATYSAVSSDLAIQPGPGSAYASDTDQLQDNASIFADSGANPTDATAPTAAAAPPPSASPTEIAALELLLAEPANQEMVAQFGPPLRPLNTGTDVGQGILARFGPDLGARLTQLQEAHNAVRAQFLQALDHAQQNPGPGVAGSELIARHTSGGNAEHITERTLYSITHPPSASQDSDLQAIEAQTFTAGGPHQNQWRLSDPAEFAKAYASGDSPAQKAFAQLHGKEPLQLHAAVEHGRGNAGPDITPAYYSLGESQLVLGGTTVTENGNPGPWAASTWQGTQLTPDQNRDLINNEYLWFDPVNGWSTDLARNIRQSTSFLDKALPIVFAGVMTFATAGAFGITTASASTSLGQTMALGAFNSATLQLTTGGKIDLGDLLRSALTAGVSFGLMDATGMNTLLQGGDLATRSLGHLGKAGLQGVLQEITGGKFKDGLANSLLASVAGEVGKILEGQIAELSENAGLNVQEVSLLRLIGRAASSAVRIAGSDDPAAGFAGDFLGGVLGEGLQGAQAKEQGESGGGNEGQPGDRPSSEWVRNLGVDAQAAQWVGAFAHPATLPSSQGFQVASASIGTVGDAGYFDDSGAYIEPAQLIWPEDATGALAYSSDGEPMLSEVQARETAQPMLPEDFRRQEIEHRNSTEVQPPQRSFTELVEMSHSPVDRYSAQEYRDAAAQYRASMGEDFRRDSIYNGLWTRSAALDGAAGGGWGQEVINDITGFATEEGLHAQAGVAIGGALGRGIGNRLGGSVDNVSGAAGTKPDGAMPAAGSGVGEAEAAGARGASVNGANSATKPVELTFDKGSQTWTTPAGIDYGSGSMHGNRVQHVLDHAVPNPNKTTHSVFNVERKEVLGLIDEAWLKKGKPLPNDSGAYVVSMGRTIGTAGENSIKIIVRPGTNKIITAYPVQQ